MVIYLHILNVAQWFSMTAGSKTPLDFFTAYVVVVTLICGEQIKWVIGQDRRREGAAACNCAGRSEVLRGWTACGRCIAAVQAPSCCLLPTCCCGVLGCVLPPVKCLAACARATPWVRCAGACT